MAGSLLLVAASGLAREAAEVAARAGWRVVGCLDDDPARRGTDLLPGVPVLGAIEQGPLPADVLLAVCAGKGTARRGIVDRLAARGVSDDRYATIVDPSVTVPQSCSVGPGSILLAGCVLTASITVGRHVVCMPHVVLTHDDVLEDFATLAAGVRLGGGVPVGRAAYLGMGACGRARLRDGPAALRGMGAMLLTDQPAQTVWVGAPARPIGCAS